MHHKYNYLILDKDFHFSVVYICSVSISFFLTSLCYGERKRQKYYYCQIFASVSMVANDIHVFSS